MLLKSIKIELITHDQDRFLDPANTAKVYQWHAQKTTERRNVRRNGR